MGLLLYNYKTLILVLTLLTSAFAEFKRITSVLPEVLADTMTTHRKKNVLRIVDYDSILKKTQRFTLLRNLLSRVPFVSAIPFPAAEVVGAGQHSHPTVGLSLFSCC